MRIRFCALWCVFLSAISFGQMAIEDEIKIAKLLIQNNLNIEAIGHFNAILIRDPENLEARLFRAGTFITAFNEAERAQNDLDFCIRANYRPAQTAYYHAKILFQEGKYNAAVKEYETACSHITEIELHSAHEVYYFSGLARASAEDYVGSIRDYNLAQEHNPLDCHIWMMRSESQMALNQLDAALIDVERAIELANDDFSKGLAWLKKGEIKRKQENYADACTCFKLAADLGNLLAQSRWEECSEN